VDLRNEMGFGMVCHALASGIRGVLRVSTWPLGSERVLDCGTDGDSFSMDRIIIS
jgi:hypothetical protein